jgi:hypothetical protein
MHCYTLTLPSLRSSSSQLTKPRSSKQQVGELPWNSAFTFHILLLSTDLAAFLNSEQIIIHICPRLVNWPIPLVSQHEEKLQPTKLFLLLTCIQNPCHRNFSFYAFNVNFFNRIITIRKLHTKLHQCV